jgi:murein DD-endopeptidase MepM/ murein hydrolase activator NlpD
VLHRVVVVGLILGAVAAVAAYFVRAPHDRYALLLKFSRADAEAVHRWNASAEESLNHPRVVALPLVQQEHITEAVAYQFQLRRGQRYVVDAGRAQRVFVDVFRSDATGLRHAGSAPADRASLSLEALADAAYIVRIQPELAAEGDVMISQRVEPSLGMPVQGASRASIQSGFGAARDAGARQHQGVDIFAPRGTPAIAAADGLVTSVGTNGLGGNVVWMVRPLRAESLYYAHLDTQLVKAGSYVRRGDVLGTVGNTGNARGGPTHLHFGIYARGGAVDPFPYLASVKPPAKKPLSNHRRAAAR